MMLKQQIVVLLLVYSTCCSCQTDIRSIFARASHHLTSILGSQYQNEVVSAAICFQREEVFSVAGERIECKDQPEGRGNTHFLNASLLKA